MSKKLEAARVGKKHDRRVKLTDAQRDELVALKGKFSQRELARMYGVSRRLIVFIHYPERLLKNIENRNERGGSKQYYDKERHRLSMSSHSTTKES